MKKSKETTMKSAFKIITLLILLSVVFAQDASDLTLYIQYNACSIGFQNGNDVMVLELSPTENDDVKFLSRSGKVGEDGILKEGLLTEHYLNDRAPGENRDANASSFTIIASGIRVEWSTSNHDGGWLYVPQGYRISIIEKGRVHSSNTLVGGFTLRPLKHIDGKIIPK